MRLRHGLDEAVQLAGSGHGAGVLGDAIDRLEQLRGAIAGAGRDVQHGA
jgi:hypothetical protein